MPNYITLLEYRVTELQAHIDGMEIGLLEVLSYLSSPKFEATPTVQVADMVRRIQEARLFAKHERHEQAECNHQKITEISSK